VKVGSIEHDHEAPCRRQRSGTSERKLSMSTTPSDEFNARSVITDERGLSTVEYVVLLVLVVAACIGLWMNFGKDLRDKLTSVNNAFGQVTFQAGGLGAGPGGNSPRAATPSASPPASPPAMAPLAEGVPTKAKEDR
jgi:Flp pilus assembly pilin Flp